MISPSRQSGSVRLAMLALLLAACEQAAPTQPSAAAASPSRHTLVYPQVPVGSIDNGYPRISWSPVPDADVYWVYMWFYDPFGTQQGGVIATTTDTTYLITQMKATGVLSSCPYSDIRWAIRVHYSDGHVSLLGDGRCFYGYSNP